MPKVTKAPADPAAESAPVETSAKSPKKAKAAKPKKSVVYPEIDVRICKGDEAITEEAMKELLGWEVVTDANFLFKDLEGNKVRLLNNAGNRPFQRANADAIQQEILRKRFKLNGETLIVGRNGSCLSIQHRGIGLILACQEWRANKDKYPQWKKSPTMESLLVLGIPEDDDVVNTIETGKPRTIEDVLYRSGLFGKMADKDRLIAARMCGYSLRLFWYRTGCGDAYSPGLRNTHAEFMNLIERHPRLIDCVKHLHEENSNGVIAKQYLSPGKAAGLMYLMAMSGSDGAKYRLQESPGESDLNDSNWDKAEAFWTELAGGEDGLKAIGEALVGLRNAHPDGLLSDDERTATIVKGWLLYVGGKPVTSKGLDLEYKTDDEGFRHLIECPTTGGIDLGKPGDADEILDESADQPEGDPNPDEIKARAAEIREGNVKKQNYKYTPGEAVDVKQAGNEWGGEYVETVKQGNRMVAKVKDEKGDVYDVDLKNLSPAE